MIPVIQSRIGDRGTCFRACLASILELGEQDVPDFNGDDPSESEYWRRVNEFLAGRGLRYQQVPIAPEAAAPLGWHTIEGLSPRGGQHAVVGYNGTMIHDPHPTWDDPRRGLVEPKVWGLLLPITSRAVEKRRARAYDDSAWICKNEDVALSGSALMSALQPVRVRHDDMPSRFGCDPQSTYRSTSVEVTMLVRETATLLRRSRISDKSEWLARINKAEQALSLAKVAAANGDYGLALARQEYAITATHHVLDALRGLARRGGAKDAGRLIPLKPPFKPGDPIRLKNGRRSTVTKVVKAENLFHEPEWHVSTASGDVVIVKRGQ